MRSLADLPGVAANMARAAADLPDSIVVPLSRAVAADVKGQGGRYHVKGRSGRPVQLDAKVSRDRFAGANEASRVVAGTPPGFWRIIEEGSSPHLIAGRYRSTGRRRGARAATNQFLRGDSFAGSSPINIPGIGWRQNAVHPGHGSVGRPWRRAMDKADNTTRDVTRDVSERALTKAFFK